MNISDFNIGIEIEYTNGSTSLVSRAIQNQNVDCELVPYGRCHSTHRGWIVTTDATVSRNIRYSSGEADGGEVVSPKLKYLDALEQVQKVCDAINSVDNVSVNRNCGLHISISWPNMGVEEIKNVAKRYAEYEREIDAFMPPSRRGNRNRWCGSLGNSWVSRVTDASNNRISQLRVGGKFIKLNLSNLDDGARSRIEFRHHSGTTDAAKIQRWIEFLCHFIIKAQSNSLLNTQYRRTRNILFAEVREQMENVGITMKNGKEEGERVFRLYRGDEYVGVWSHQEIDEMYVGGVQAKGKGNLNENFIHKAARFARGELDSGLYCGQPAHVTEFYQARTRYFAN